MVHMPLVLKRLCRDFLPKSRAKKCKTYVHFMLPCNEISTGQKCAPSHMLQRPKNHYLTNVCTSWWKLGKGGGEVRLGVLLYFWCNSICSWSKGNLQQERTKPERTKTESGEDPHPLYILGDGKSSLCGWQQQLCSFPNNYKIQSKRSIINTAASLSSFV